MAETTSPAPSTSTTRPAARRGAVAARPGRLPWRVTVRRGGPQTRAALARALNELNGIAAAAAVLLVMKLVSFAFTGVSAEAGYAEFAAGLGTALLLIRCVTLVRAVPAAPDSRA